MAYSERRRRRIARLIRPLRLAGRQIAEAVGPAPPVALNAVGTAEEVWLVDLLGAAPETIADLVGHVLRWRDAMAPGVELTLLVDPAAQPAAAGVGFPVYVGTDPDEAIRVTATIGASRTVALRRLPDLGPYSVRIEPVADAACAPLGPLIFIGGTGRSGTWTLGRMLDRHPGIWKVQTELWFHTQPFFAAMFEGRISADRFARELVSKWYRTRKSTGDPKGLQLLVSRTELDVALERFVSRAGVDVPRAMRTLMSELVDPIALDRGAGRWAETTPANVASAGTLTRLFPTAKVVHMVRDGRDAAASIATMNWGPDRIEKGLEWWGERMRSAQLGVADADRRRVLTVRLEELVHLDRERTFDQIVRFLDIDDTTEIERHFQQRVSAAGAKIGRWRSQVPERRRHRFEERYREILIGLADVGTPCPPTDPGRVDDLVSGGHDL